MSMEILKPDGMGSSGGGGGGMLSRIAERLLSWVALGLVVLLGVAIYQMPGATKAAIWSAIWRAVVWGLIVVATPWGARLFIGRILLFSTNWAGVLLLAGMFLVDICAGFLLMTGWPDGGWAWFGVIASLALAGTYNFLVAEYLAQEYGDG
ncbi:MAG: hypothetical protein JNG88_13605 [Phycisphaerales bacterium]|nr:hypothetical protein [Phycisphaerales bacterium]